MDSLGVPAKRPRPTPHATSSNEPLRLPSLPRFHPANFPSQSPSAANTPVSGINSPQPPMSPRSQQRQYSEAQRQLYFYQRELLAAGHQRSPSAKQAGGPKPTSPRLIPMGSPGPVTPLELEAQQGGYLIAGAARAGQPTQGDLIEKLIREEAKRRGEMSRTSTSTSVGGS
ncbi:hypothetical protein M501DRAFT_1011958 [Patellaria atrata CBS 101060]|uniref:Uncharacterized protein n=1 Tax=Patellaria atrata CBS 101060 TaxID=1346257 RepID=A0A9P4S998_9PEZI|nr:hypothetical protein M501DRAFT_1011958 [Patellaria atrata CBS 101060]